ncbi:GspH/FimT family pseudopilin [Luteimonas sp. e5]
MARFIPRCSGFTLVEACISLAVLALITGIGLPGFQQLLAANRVRAASHELSAGFASARLAAVSRNIAVVACPGDGLRCQDDSDWSRGWMVFHDPDRDLQPNRLEDILSVHQPRSDRLRVVSSQGRRQLRYLPSGRSHGSNLTVSICEGGRLHARVIVNNVGRVRSEQVRPARDCPA